MVLGRGGWVLGFGYVESKEVMEQKTAQKVDAGMDAGCLAYLLEVVT